MCVTINTRDGDDKQQTLASLQGLLFDDSRNVSMKRVNMHGMATGIFREGQCMATSDFSTFGIRVTIFLEQQKVEQKT